MRSSSPKLSAFSCCMLSIYLAMISNCQAGSLITEEEESRLRQALANAVVVNPVLQGAWVILPKPENPDERLVLNAVLDSNETIQTSQKVELDRVVKSAVKEVDYKLNVIEQLPFAEFVSELKSDVELSADMAGAILDGAYLSLGTGPEDVQLFLVGRVVSDDQRERMHDLANLRLPTLFDGSMFSITDAKTVNENEGYAEVEVVRPVPAVTSFCFNLALHRFRSQNYEDAYDSFTQAHLESPSRRDIQYWRVVCLIGCGRESDAKKLLKGLADESRRRGSVPAETEIFRSLEQVQGPLRWQLMTMENSLFCKICGQ